MKSYITSRCGAIAAAGGVVAALSFGGVAQAITDTVFRYSAPKTGFYSIDRFALNPIGSFFGAMNYNREWNGGLWNNGTDANCFGTGINLPHGATLASVRVWYSSDTDGNPAFRFIAQEFASPAQTIIFVAAPSDNSATVRSVNIPVDPLKINNSQTSYALTVCLSPNDIFYSARVTYTYDNAGD
jgi:hypothetical protein